MKSRTAWGLAIVLVALHSVDHLRAQGDHAIAHRQYFVDVKMFSLIPGAGLESYRGYGGGGAAGRATVGLGAADERKFSVDVKVSTRKKDLIVKVIVKPSDLDPDTLPLEREFVMSDLQPQSLQLATNEDGRIYQLNLTPRINQFPKPKTLDANAMRLDFWTFQNSAVILNDQDYLGRLGMSSGRYAWIDIPGNAKIEFSLVNFRDAEPIGTLQNGTIQISHRSGQSLRISDVKNGVYRETLQGGPYTVYVRWSPPTSSIEQYRKQLASTIERIRKDIAGGDPPLTRALMERLQKARDSDRIMMMSNGLGPIPREDRL